MSDYDEPVVIHASDFYRKWLTRNLSIFIVIQLLAATIIAIMFYLLTTHTSLEIFMIFCICMISFFVMETVVGALIIKKTAKPIMIVSQKISNNLDNNDPEIDKNGMRYFLDEIGKTEQKTNVPIATNNGMLQKIMDSLPIGIIAFDRNGKIIMANNLAPTYIDETGETKMQLDFRTANCSFDDWLIWATENRISDEKVWNRIEDTTPNNVASRRIFDVIAHYYKNATNGIETIVITVDRTAEYEDEEDSVSFIALAAHELRAPITVVRGYLDVLSQKMDSSTSPEIKKIIERIANGANSLSGYITNMLSISRYEHEDLKLNITELSIVKIINNISDSVGLSAHTMNRRLIFEIPSDLPTVAADLSLISEVLTNLIGNAIKYSPDGGAIIIRAEKTSDNFVTLSVQDHGVGMPENVMKNLFSKFYRSHKSKNVSSGTGLGLYISRAIIKNHGGEIGVDSVEGKGSTFFFTLPIFAKYDDIKTKKTDFTIQTHSKIIH
ncbi:MAG: PAS domain-containing sensor histidine kinase [Candidatus Nomurabacteria bacterium]|jgi:signal transduction histidine kinase|nr:PAS domain-containing sensor histidine kinase [Candidatus Nomurabacteria bacterium]